MRKVIRELKSSEASYAFTSGNVNESEMIK